MRNFIIKMTSRLFSSIAGARKYSNNKSFLKVAVNEQTSIISLLLNRAPVNALNLEFLTELSDKFDEVAKQKPSGVIITSLSKKVFSAGLDFTELINPDPKRLHDFWKSLQDASLKLYKAPFPTAAVVNGHAPAAGCLLALCCEYRVMLHNFLIGLNETQVGIFTPRWLNRLMRDTIGNRSAEMALTTGYLFNTIEASNVGLIDEIGEDEADAARKAGAFFEKFENVNSDARNRMKVSLRGLDFEVEKNLEEELNEEVAFLLTPKVQQNLMQYFERVKQNLA